MEAVPEGEALKAGIFRQLDGLAPPHVVLASNTSSISITRLAAATQRPDRVVGLHFMNPVGGWVGGWVGWGGWRGCIVRRWLGGVAGMGACVWGHPAGAEERRQNGDVWRQHAPALPCCPAARCR